MVHFNKKERKIEDASFKFADFNISLEAKKECRKRDIFMVGLAIYDFACLNPQLKKDARRIRTMAKLNF